MNTPKELEFQTIKEFPNYQINILGKVWSLNRRKNLVQYVDQSGYFYVSLYNNAKRYKRTIHRLLLTTFIREPKEGEVCRHLNGNPKDNRLENLKWGTQSENVMDAIRHGHWTKVGTTVFGEQVKNSKLTEQDVRTIIYLCQTKLFQKKEIAKMYGVNPTCIIAIEKKKTWKHLWRT